MTSQIVFGADRLPLPPVDAVANASVANVTGAVYGIGVLILLAWAWFGSGQGRIVTAMVIGGALTSIIEPLINVTAGAWHPLVGQSIAFTLAGHGVPVWVVIAYALYYGGIGSLMLLSFNRGISRRGVWLWVLGPMIFNILIEVVMLHYNLYYYIGNQPLVVAKFPLVQMACNAAALLGSLTALYLLQPALKGWRIFPGAVILMPVCAVMGWGAVVLPDFFAVNSTWPNWAVQTCGVLVFALTALLVHIVAQFVSGGHHTVESQEAV